MKAEYLLSDLWVHNIENDRASSITIPWGTSVDLFTEDSFHGRRVTLVGNTFEDKY